MKGLNTRKIVKRMIAFFLALAMCVNVPSRSAKAEDGIITLTPDSSYDVGACLITTDQTTIANESYSGTYYLDGVEKTFDYDSGVFWWGTGENSIYLWINNVATLQEGASSADELYSHLLTIKEGTKIGDWTVGKTLNFRIYQGTMTLLESVAETTVNYVGSSAQDGDSGARYWITLGMPNLDQSMRLPNSIDFFDWHESSIYIDGEVKTCGEYYFTDLENKETMGLFLNYEYLEEGVTSASEIKEEHIVTIKAGTLIQDVYVTNDLTLRINPGGSVDVLSTVIPQWEKNEVNGNYRYIYYTFTGEYTEHPLNYDEGKVRLILGDKSVNCDWSKYTSEEGKYGVCFRVREAFLADGDVIIFQEGTSIGNCQVGEAVYTQFSSTDTADYGTALIAVENTINDMAWTGSQYYIYINVQGVVADNGNSDLPVQINGTTETVTVWRFNDNQPLVTIDPSSIVSSGNTDEIVDAKVIIPAGTIYQGCYYFKNSLGITINGTTQTIFDVEETQPIEVPDVDLPDAIVVPADDYRNDTRVAETDFYFKTLASDPLSLRDPSSGNPYSFKTGGFYLNDADEPMSGVELYKWLDNLYYVYLGTNNTLQEKDIVTLKGIVEISGTSVEFQETKFYVDDNLHLALWDGNTSYESVLEDVYVDLGENDYVIPMADSIKVNEEPVNVETGRTLSDAGEYAVERVDGHVTYQQNVICYEIGDANADGKINVADLVAIKNSSKHTKVAEVKGADVTNDSNVNDADLTVMRELLVDKTTIKETREKYQELVFGVISDTHILGDTGEPVDAPVLKRREKFKKALTYYKSNNAKLIIINGDVSEFGMEDSYRVLRDIIDEVYPEGEYRPQFIFTADNHEYWDAWDSSVTFEYCQNVFKTGLGLEDVNNHYTVGGYEFISISSDDMSGSDATYSNETVTYLEAELAKAATRDTTKPIFVAIHQPEHESVESSRALYDKLREYPQVVLFTSHTHNMLNDERSIVQDKFTTVNTAATHYANVDGSYENHVVDSTPSGYNFAQGLLVRAKGSVVEIDRYDIYNDQKIGETWSIATTDCADEDTLKYTDELRYAAAVAPTFAEEITVNAEWATLNSCTLTFASATADEGDFVYRYKIVVKDATGTEVATYYYLNDFWHKYIPETVTFTVPNLDCFESYSFEITAEETYGKSSGALEGTIKSVIEN